MDMTLFTTGTLARAAGISVESIRNLERKGVLAPRRDATGRRIFTISDLRRISVYRRRHVASQKVGPAIPNQTTNMATTAR
jgi:DNA-binding transcriptional MerR regulator